MENTWAAEARFQHVGQECPQGRRIKMAQTGKGPRNIPEAKFVVREPLISGSLLTLQNKPLAGKLR